MEVVERKSPGSIHYLNDARSMQGGLREWVGPTTNMCVPTQFGAS